MRNISKSPFKVLPGWILAKPYIDKNDTFQSVKETSGDCMVSEVLAVGDSYIDDSGNHRDTKVKVGDVILHIWETNTVTIKFDKYRLVHFSRVIGIK